MTIYVCIRCYTCNNITSLANNDACKCAKCGRTDLAIVPLLVPPAEYAGGGKVYALEEWT